MIWINIWIQEFFRNFSKLQNRSLSAICALGEVRTLLDYYFLIWPDLHENFTRDVSLDKDTYSPLNFGNHPDLDPDSGIFNGILFTVLDPRRTLRQWVIFIARRVTTCTARYCFAISVCQSVECWYYSVCLSVCRMLVLWTILFFGLTECKAFSASGIQAVL